MTVLPQAVVLKCLVDAHWINSRNFGNKVLPPRESDSGTGEPLQKVSKSVLRSPSLNSLFLLHCCMMCLVCQFPCKILTLSEMKTCKMSITNPVY